MRMRASRGPTRRTPWQPRQRVVLSLIGGRPDGERSSGLLAHFSPSWKAGYVRRRSRLRFKGRPIVSLVYCSLLAHYASSSGPEETVNAGEIAPCPGSAKRRKDKLPRDASQRAYPKAETLK